jgi:hypothetical protein
VLAAIIAVVGFFSMDTSKETEAISKAVYVEDGKVLPENEGKIVIVPGKLEAVTPLVDEITGVELPGVIAKRTVERYEKVLNSEEEGTYYTLEWKNTILGKDNEFNDIVSSSLIAEAKIGEFTIDNNALHHVAVGKPFTDFDYQVVGQRGYTVHPTTSVTYISKMEFMPVGNEEFNSTVQYNGRKVYYMDYENMPRISYVTQKVESGEYTFIGKQQNGKIMYDKDLGMQAAFDGLQNPTELAERVESGGMTGAIVAWALAAFFVLLAVLGMKKKKEN